jgi:carbonic anhydrase
MTTINLVNAVGEIIVVSSENCTGLKSSVRNSKKKQSVSITTINWLMLIRETIAAYAENYTEHINTLCGQSAALLTDC